MKSKLDLIFRELKIWKLKVEGLENRYTRENLKDETRGRRRENTWGKKGENTYRRRDGEYDIICRIKIDPLTFNGILDPKIFSDWIADLDYYFEKVEFSLLEWDYHDQMNLLDLDRESTLGVGFS